jgi:hypothetical protein
MLLIGIALLSIPMGWVAYQLNWIHQRNEFYARYKMNYTHQLPRLRAVRAPWPLRLFGESGRDYIAVPKEFMPEAKRLFPEAGINELASRQVIGKPPIPNRHDR